MVVGQTFVCVAVEPDDIVAEDFAVGKNLVPVRLKMNVVVCRASFNTYGFQRKRLAFEEYLLHGAETSSSKISFSVFVCDVRAGVEFSAGRSQKCNDSMLKLVVAGYLVGGVALPAQVVVGAVVALDSHTGDWFLVADFAAYTIVLRQLAQIAQCIWAHCEYHGQNLSSIIWLIYHYVV